MPAQESGLVTSYIAPTATTAGSIVFSYKYVRAVAPATTVAGLVPGSHACVTEGLDALGDRVVTALVDCPPAQVN